MKQGDFIFTIGYQGNTAIVDGKAKKQYENSAWKQLAEHGLYKTAYCAVLQAEDPAALGEFVSFFNARVRDRVYGKDDLSRLFGVYGVPEKISRTQIIM